VATARSSQAHEKRVQQIANEAAAKVAADAPLEEEVVVVIEELPPGESARKQGGRTSRSDQTAGDTLVGMVAQSQKLVADGMSRWLEMTSAPFGARSDAMGTFGVLFDARRLTEEAFRLAEELLESQKEFALKVAEAIAPTRAA